MWIIPKSCKELTVFNNSSPRVAMIVVVWRCCGRYCFQVSARINARFAHTVCFAAKTSKEQVSLLSLKGASVRGMPTWWKKGLSLVETVASLLGPAGFQVESIAVSTPHGTSRCRRPGELPTWPYENVTLLVAFSSPHSGPSARSNRIWWWIL